jgi:GNAT superfamily N-acetyltransferase
MRRSYKTIPGMPDAALPLRIEPAIEADVPLILGFIRELAEYERMLDKVVATEAGLREQLFGARPGAEVVIARSEGQPVGFALYFHNFSTFLGRRGLYLEDLFVRPSHRGRGVGRALLAHLARNALERGCGRLEWWVLDWNEPAIGFYRKLGAEPMSDWTVFRLSGAPLAELAQAAADGARS